MINRLPTVLAVLAIAGGVAACQGGQRMAMLSPGPAPAPAPAATPMDGRWASPDGIFVASFDAGNFTSIDPQTDAVLARGSYNVAGGQVNINWLSTTANERRSATCSFVGGRNRVSCVQQSGATFDLQRV